jgi:hypothetical protein
MPSASICSRREGPRPNLTKLSKPKVIYCKQKQEWGDQKLRRGYEFVVFRPLLLHSNAVVVTDAKQGIRRPAKQTRPGMGAETTQAHCSRSCTAQQANTICLTPKKKGARLARCIADSGPRRPRWPDRFLLYLQQKYCTITLGTSRPRPGGKYGQNAVSDHPIRTINNSMPAR